VVEQAVGPRATEALVEENEQGRHADAFGGESVAVGLAGALPQAGGFHLAQVVAERGQGIGLGGEAEGAENSFVDRGGWPAVQLGAAVQPHLHQADHPRVLDLDPGYWGLADLDGESQALEKGEVDLHVKVKHSKPAKRSVAATRF